MKKEVGQPGFPFALYKIVERFKVAIALRSVTKINDKMEQSIFCVNLLIISPHSTGNGISKVLISNSPEGVCSRTPLDASAFGGCLSKTASSKYLDPRQVKSGKHILFLDFNAYSTWYGNILKTVY